MPVVSGHKTTKRWVDLNRWVDLQRENCREIAVLTGCFDLFHAGHARFLKGAKTQDRRRGIERAVLVCLDSDKRVAFLKGHGRPIIPFAQRKAVLEACRWGDRVEGFDTIAELTEITGIAWPDLTIRADGDTRKVFGYSGKILRVKTPPIHTSDIIQRVLESQG